MLIGLCGIARSGKNTLADILIANKVVSTEYALASPIKNLVCTLFDWGASHREGDLKEVDCYGFASVFNMKQFKKLYTSYGLDAYMNPEQALTETLKQFNVDLTSYTTRISPREAFQTFGTDFGRDKLDNHIWTKIAPTEGVVVTDIRFPNEAQYIKDNGGILIKVQRDNKVKVRQHKSEAFVDLIDCDTTIINNGTLKDLERSGLSYIKSLEVV